jgi:hypothetical protein
MNNAGNMAGDMTRGIGRTTNRLAESMMELPAMGMDVAQKAVETVITPFVPRRRR